MEDVIQVSYALTFQEFRKFQRYFRWSIPRHRMALVASLVLQLILSWVFGSLIGAIFGGPRWAARHPDIVQIPTSAIIGYIIAGTVTVFLLIRLIAFLRFRLKVWRLYKNTMGREMHSITVGPERFVSESEKGKSEVKWTGFIRVLKKPDLLMLFLHKGAAFIIPARAFDTEDEWRNFIALVDKYWLTGKQTV